MVDVVVDGGDAGAGGGGVEAAAARRLRRRRVVLRLFVDCTEKTKKKKNPRQRDGERDVVGVGVFAVGVDLRVSMGEASWPWPGS